MHGPDFQKGHRVQPLIEAEETCVAIETAIDRTALCAAGGSPSAQLERTAKNQAREPWTSFE